MTFTYDPATDIGKIRLHCQDTDTTLADPLRSIFTDEDLQALLDGEDDDVKLAAAQACDTKANRLVLTLRDETSGDYTIRASGMAAILQETAKRLREQVDTQGTFDFAETDWEDLL